jgi:hypothetical protein
LLHRHHHLLLLLLLPPRLLLRLPPLPLPLVLLLLTGALGASATSPVATVGHSCYYFVVYEDHCAVSLPLAHVPKLTCPAPR